MILLRYFLILALTVTAFGGAYIYDFQARSEGDNVKIEWKTQEEVNLIKFVIERRSQQGPFMEIATIQPKGSNSFYSFVDESAYKPQDVIFVYRLKIVDVSEVSYSNEMSIAHSVSGIKRTWGSIKAMFR
jgi:hypothetical protein